MPGWSLATRVRQFHLDADAVAEDLARLDVPARGDDVARWIIGDEPVPPVVLPGLVDVLELRDRALSDATVVTAVTGPWLRAGRTVPVEVLTILATTRYLSIAEVKSLTFPGSLS